MQVLFLLFLIEHQFFQEAELVYIERTLLRMLLVQAVDNLIGPLVLALLDVDSGTGLRKDATAVGICCICCNSCICWLCTCFCFIRSLILACCITILYSRCIFRSICFLAFLLLFLLLIAFLLFLLLILVELESAFFYEGVDEGDGS